MNAGCGAAGAAGVGDIPSDGGAVGVGDIPSDGDALSDGAAAAASLSAAAAWIPDAAAGLAAEAG